MVKFLYVLIINLYFSLCSSESAEYFPWISIDNQRRIYDKYLLLLSSQEDPSQDNTQGMLWDSKIDIKRAHEFRKNIKEKTVRSVIVADVGGSSLKLSFITRRRNGGKGGEFVVSKNKKHIFAVENMLDPLSSYTWHDWVAKNLGIFLRELRNEFPRESLPRTVAFSFSFKIEQSDLGSAKFVDVRKDWWFSGEDVDSKDVVADLNRSLEKRQIDLRINSVVNDVIATFMSGIAVDNMKDFMSIIIGTGTNAGFVMRRGEKETLVNSEWASFEVEGLFPVDEITRGLVEESNSTGKRYLLLEILTAGMKMDYIIKERVKKLNRFMQEEVESFNAKRIYEVEKKARGGGRLSELEEVILGVFSEFKTRAYRILVPMILAVMKEAKEISIITNGTVIGTEYDTGKLEEELKEGILRLSGGEKRVKQIRYEENASLIGAAFTSIVFSEQESE